MSLEKHSCEHGRYISHVEDDPQVWQSSFATLDKAINATRALVTERMVRNGAGDGVVYDCIERRIVATCDAHITDGTFCGSLQVDYHPSPKHLARCAEVVEGWRSGSIVSIDG